MVAVAINVPGVKAAMEQAHTCLEDTFVQFGRMNDALDVVVKAHQSENAKTIQQDVCAIEEDLRTVLTEMTTVHHEVYEKGNALLRQASQPEIAEPPVPNMPPARTPGSYSDDEILYDPQALEHYNEAHGNMQQAGTVVAEINDLFQNKIPAAFASDTSQSIVAHHGVIHGKFDEAHAGIIKLLGETAPGEVDDLLALDRQLSGS